MKPYYGEGWAKMIVHWVTGTVAYLSIAFTWQLPQAYSLCVWYAKQGYVVKVGGPAVKLMPDYLASVATLGDDMEVLAKHNSRATFTSRGCIRRCKFCAVPKIEGDLVELDNWDAKPIVCDNNLLACSQRHFNSVVDRLKSLRGIDFNQGLDARLLADYHIERLKELDCKVLRFAWDDARTENVILPAIDRVLQAGYARSKVRCYVLFNFEDSPDDALYRCNTLKQLGILPNVQRFQPLNTLKKNSHVAPLWNKALLADFTRYWSKQIWLRAIPFEEYRRRRRQTVVVQSQEAMELNV